MKCSPPWTSRTPGRSAPGASRWACGSGLALALIARPRLLVLDEPTNGLDPIGIEELRDQIRGFAAAGTTVIVSSHILSEVQQMADTIGIICGGRLAYEDALRPGQDLEELFMSFCREGRRARGEVAA